MVAGEPVQQLTFAVHWQANVHGITKLLTKRHLRAWYEQPNPYLAVVKLVIQTLRKFLFTFCSTTSVGETANSPCVQTLGQTIACTTGRGSGDTATLGVAAYKSVTYLRCSVQGFLLPLHACQYGTARPSHLLESDAA